MGTTRGIHETQTYRVLRGVWRGVAWTRNQEQQADMLGLRSQSTGRGRGHVFV